MDGGFGSGRGTVSKLKFSEFVPGSLSRGVVDSTSQGCFCKGCSAVDGSEPEGQVFASSFVLVSQGVLVEGCECTCDHEKGNGVRNSGVGNV